MRRIVSMAFTMLITAVVIMTGYSLFSTYKKSASTSVNSAEIITQHYLSDLDSYVGKVVLGDKVRYLIAEYGEIYVIQVETRESYNLTESCKIVTSVADVDETQNEWFISPSSEFLISGIYSQEGTQEIIGLSITEKGG